MKGIRTVLGLTVLLLAGACARSDVGSPCHVQDLQGAEITPQPGRQYLYLGSGECETFACLATSGYASGYCSQPCAGQGASCPGGMSCSQLNTSKEYLDAMKARLPADRYNALFGQITSTWYCVKSVR